VSYQPAEHLADQLLSAFIDDQLAPDEAEQAKAHLETCAVCRARLDELRALVVLLRDLPSLEPPRDFSIGLRLVVDPPNVVRLRRWYGGVRVGAATLAAAFVFLLAGALYVDRQPVSSNVELSSRPQLAAAPAASPALRAAAAPPAPAPVPGGPGAPADAAAGAPAPANAAAPAGASAPSGAAPGAPPSAATSSGATAGAASAAGGAGGPAAQLAPAAPAAPAAAAAARAKPAPTDEVTDQVTAATSVRPLPTPAATPVPGPTPSQPKAAQAPFTVATAEPAAPLRTATAIVGLLAVGSLLATLVVRHRLRAASTSPTE
jgi:hypothetical protein